MLYWAHVHATSIQDSKFQKGHAEDPLKARNHVLLGLSPVLSGVTLALVAALAE